MAIPEEPASGPADSPRSGPSFLARRGPFLLVGVTAVLVAGVIGFAFVTRDEEVILEAPTTTTIVEEVPESSIAYPLSFSQAKTAGTVDTIDWGERCDTSTGRLAVPDFFAPECMAPFVGDNGGATSTGVGSKTIKIVHYQVPDTDPIRRHINGRGGIDDTVEQQSIAIADFFGYFQRFYEFYGRSVEVVTFQSKSAASDEAGARADAQKIAEQIRPFAVVGGPALTNAFADELAARKILCIDCGMGSTQWFKDRAPYVWSTDASGTQKQIHLTELVDKQLKGKPAAFGGDAVRSAPRVFGHVYLDRGPESKLLADQLVAQFAAIGAGPVESIPYTLDPADMINKGIDIVAKLKAAGVTTVILSTDAATPRELTAAATLDGYFPEWLVAAAPNVDSTRYGRTYNSKQWLHAFGVSNSAARSNPELRNYYSLYEWFMGRAPYADDTIESLMPPYAFLMSAIQSTGPNLTPETFAESIRGLATKQAVSQPFFRWGDNSIWQDGDFSGIEDATLFWWDPQAVGLDERGRSGNGMTRYGDGGKRYLPGEWPAEDRLFVVDGSVTIFETVPPGEETPTYPSPLVAEATTQPEATEPASTQAPPATDGAAFPQG